MAELFLAQAPPRDELVVIKRILPYLAEEPEFVQMFLDEARIAAQLHHPNIVQVHELGSIGESIFIAMEYLAGVDLRRILGEEMKFSAAVPYAVAARICAQLASGLDYAHISKGVDGRPLELIHRDVSPQNVMVGYDGSVKLVDFGIAKAGAFMERSKPGVIKGKFLYLSPEQVAQERLDHRTDIFALGVMLYEITTGRAPFARPTTEGILYAIRFENPSPPHLLRDDYPPELSRIVMRCLVKDREQRYQRATEVQEDLEALLDSGVMRQSDDVAAYVARLLGEEEERTVLHIPVAQSPDAKVSVPAGLAPRPVRRPSAESARPTVEVGAEIATKMARPRELLAAAAAELDEEEESEPTAIRTVPGRPGALPGAAVPPERASARAPEPPEESTVDERPARPGSPARRSGSARKPSSTTEPLAPLERRRTPPLEDESSISLTPATVNARAPLQGSPDLDPGFFADEEEVDPTRLIPLRPVPPPEDDESTSGFDNTFTEPGSPPAPRSRGRGLLLTVLVLLLLAGAGGAAWLFWLEPLLLPAPPTPSDMARTAAPVEVGDSVDMSEEVGGAPAPGASSDTVAGDSEEPKVEAAGPESGRGLVEPAAGEAQAREEEGLAATEIPVTFKALAKTDIRVVGKRQVKPNTSLPLRAGEQVRIRYRCPVRKAPWVSVKYTVPADASEPAVVTLDCRTKRRK